MTDHDAYVSPFSWRYASPEMRRLWGEAQKHRTWRRIWVALAQAQSEFGLVKPEQVAELRSGVDAIDLDRALAIEAEIHHDLMAEVWTFAEQCPTAGCIIHLGATSMDIEDNADALRLHAALGLIETRLAAVLELLARRALELAAVPTSLLALIKPQFEAPRSAIKKGIVRDDAVHKAVCDDIAAFAENLGCRDIAVFPSSIDGGDGNDQITAGSGYDKIDGGPGYDVCQAGGGTNLVKNCER